MLHECRCFGILLSRLSFLDVVAARGVGKSFRRLVGHVVLRLLGHGLTYTDTVEQFTKYYHFTPEELDWIMGKGICEVLDWPIAPEGSLAK